MLTLDQVVQITSSWDGVVQYVLSNDFLTGVIAASIAGAAYGAYKSVGIMAFKYLLRKIIPRLEIDECAYREYAQGLGVIAVENRHRLTIHGHTGPDVLIPSTSLQDGAYMFANRVLYRVKIGGRWMYVRRTVRYTDFDARESFEIFAPFCSTAAFKRHLSGLGSSQTGVRVGQYGAYNRAMRVGETNGRGFDALVISEKHRRIITEAISTFKENKLVYQQLDVPHKLTFLFTGPPGYGKSSLAKAIGDYAGMDIVYLTCENLFGNIPVDLTSGRVYVLDDVDVAGLPIDRSKSPDTKTYADVLSFLDGRTLDGSILVMTTNRPEVFDEAFVRPGRIDVRLTIDSVDICDIKDWLWRLYPHEQAAAVHSAAEVIHHIGLPTAKQYLVQSTCLLNFLLIVAAKHNPVPKHITTTQDVNNVPERILQEEKD